jgi:hypothetical protein
MTCRRLLPIGVDEIFYRWRENERIKTGGFSYNAVSFKGKIVNNEQKMHIPKICSQNIYWIEQKLSSQNYVYQLYVNNKQQTYGLNKNVMLSKIE